MCQLSTVVYSYVHLCKVVYSCLQSCTVGHSYVKLCAVMRSCVQPCTAMCSCAHWQLASNISERRVFFILSTQERTSMKKCITQVKVTAIPLQAWKDPEDSRRLRLTDLYTIDTWRWSCSQPYVPAAFTPRNIPGTHSCRGWVDLTSTVWPKGLCQRNIPMIPWGIEHATFPLVVQCLNQLHHRDYR
jgi:hypothetical protein